MEATPRDVIVAQRKDGREPFSEWVDSLDSKTEAVVLKRVERVEQGNFGDVEPVGEGVSELKIDFGSGYRVYFGQIGNDVYLLGGGKKDTQQRDIKTAKEFWREL